MDLFIAGLHTAVLGVLSWCTYRMIAMTCRRERYTSTQESMENQESTSTQESMENQESTSTSKPITNEEVVSAFIREHPTLANLVDRSVLLNFCEIITSSECSDPSEVFEKFMNQ